MKSRRGFLSLIGLGAVAAPAAVALAKEAAPSSLASFPKAQPFNGEITTTSVFFSGYEPIHDGSHTHNISDHQHGHSGFWVRPSNWPYS